MTVNRRKKNSRYRGSKTHGCGSMKKRRGAGHRGGRGAAGSGKRADSKKPTVWGGKYFGKFGFKSKSRTSQGPTMNVGFLDQHIEGFVGRKEASKEKDFYSIDLGNLGYTKLLGEGKVKNKFTVTVPRCSPQAKEKIEGMGGKVIVGAPESPKKE